MHHSFSRPSWPLRYQADQSEKEVASPRLSKVLEDNIRLISKHREENEKQKSFQDRMADLITRWSGSMLFVYGHVLWFGIWIAINLFSARPFDPFPFGLLTTIVSLEAIFLSTFVLVSQNRQAALADRRAELDLQINLLAEYEMTRVLTLVDRLAKKFDIDDCNDDELAELEQDVKPDRLLKELEDREKNSKPDKSSNMKMTS
jgi:uncharacterized membrane protein